MAWLERQLALPRVATRALVAVVFALTALFALIAVNVSTIRKPLDGEVVASFETVAPKAGGITTFARSLGCTKTRVDFYRCDVEVRARRRAESEVVGYILFLDETGCWRATVTRPADAIGRIPTLAGCVASS